MDLTLALEAPSSPALSVDSRTGWSAPRIAAAVALMAAGIFATRGAWNDIINIALRDEEASHIWLVPFLAAWLAWIRRDQLKALEPTGGFAGPLIVAMGWAIGHWGFYSAKQSPWHLGALLVVLGCAITALGVRTLLTIWPAVLVLAFLVPVPGMVRQQISIPLERATASLTCNLLSASGVPVTRSGNVITINRVPVTVAEACNGLRMVFPLFLIVYVFCFMLPLKTWLRVVLLLTSPLSAVGCNVLRLVPTVLLYGYASKTTADRFHEYSGWPMVLIAFFVLMGGLSLAKWLGIPVMSQPLTALGGSPGPSPHGYQHPHPKAILAGVVSLLLLTAMNTADKLRVDPREADTFHARVAAAVSSIPQEFGAGRGWWFAGKEMPLSADAAGLLKPNASLHRIYTSMTGRRVELMLVQCRDTRDMQGHYPPVCYRSLGCNMTLPGEAGEWKAIGPTHELSIPGREYVVTFPTGNQVIIRNFFVLPNGRLVRDMESVATAAKDYRELVYGVAQVQLLYDPGVSLSDRDAIFAELVGANLDLIEVLRSGVPGH